jgi:hypothetical protein
MQAPIPIQSAEDMALRNDDKDWVRDEIKASLSSLKPHGWKRAIFLLRELGPIATVITAFIALLAVMLGALYQSFGHVKEETEFRDNTKHAFEKIDDRLKNIESGLLAFRTTQAARNPRDRKSQDEAAQILAAARKESVQISATVVEEAGKSFINAAKNEPSAWNVALQFVNYRSFLNISSRPPGTAMDFPSGSFATRYEEPPENIIHHGSMRWIGFSRPPDVPQYRRISSPDLNTAQVLGPQFLVVDKYTVVLDQMFFKRVIFQNSHIIYKGGPVVLDNVYFINCTFEIVREPKGQLFASTLLSDPATKFTAT